MDALIDQLLPLLEEGDIIIDGGNSHFPDTIRRTKYVEEKGLLYVGTGVSGGEEGALHGPSLMPGGSSAAWPQIKPIFQAIAAKVEDGSPCADWVGADGAGHFVKMVHNGIEYGDMQLICEAYHLMKELLGLSADDMHAVFKEWNAGELSSYLMEITADILAYKDADGSPLVESILDTAGQKGTGKWTASTALDEGVPLTLIGEAVFSRCLSAQKEERVNAAQLLQGPKPHFTGDKQAFVEDIRRALYASKIVSYAQGYALMQAAAKTYNWNLNYGGHCLVVAGRLHHPLGVLGRDQRAFDSNPKLTNLLLDPFFRSQVEACQRAGGGCVPRPWLTAFPYQPLPQPSPIMTATQSPSAREPAPGPAGLLRAHTYERIDRPRGEFFHTDWTGKEAALPLLPITCKTPASLHLSPAV